MSATTPGRSAGTQGRERGERLGLIALPGAFGAAMILVGVAMYVSYGCTSTGPISSCPVPPSVYEPAFALIGAGVLAVALGIALFIDHRRTPTS